MPRPSPLNDEDQAEVVARYLNGMTTTRLAVMFDVDEASIRRCLDRFEVARRPAPLFEQRYPAGLTEVIVRMRDVEGASWSAIAAEVGMSMAGVRKRYATRRVGAAGKT